MKTFTLTQAEELIPLLRKEMAVLRPAYRQLRKEFETAARQHELSVDDPKVREICLSRETSRALFFQIEESLLLFQELGVECKAIEHGLFDFPCLVEDRLVYLCWQLDEERITHWHEIDSGYAGRRTLFEVGRQVAPGEQRLVN